jgi:hypothetical protein
MTTARIVAGKDLAVEARSRVLTNQVAPFAAIERPRLINITLLRNIT